MGDTASPMLSARVQWGLIVLVMLSYVAAFLWWYPPTIINMDESAYVRQAYLLLDGRSTADVLNLFTGETTSIRPSNFPPGTAALLALFVAVGGWKVAFLASFCALLATVLITARWLVADGRSPLFALLIAGFPPALAFGRMTTSDVPSAAVVAVGLYLFWKGLDGRRIPWLLSGFIAGASMLFRETNVVLFAPLFAGALLRRDPGWPALLIGGAAGVTLRAIVSYAAFGSVFFLKDPAYGFSLANVSRNLGVDALGLLVLIPAGLLVAVSYRGRRRPEVIVAIGLFVGVYLSFGYTAEESGYLQRLLLRLRFYIPLLPLLAFIAAEVLPRWWTAALLHRSRAVAARSARIGRWVVIFWAVGIAAIAIGVNISLYRYGIGQSRVRDLIYSHTPDRAIIVTNLRMTQRYIQDYFGPRQVVDREGRQSRDVHVLADRHGEVYVVLFDRNTSDYLKQHSLENAEFVERIEHPMEVVLDEPTSDTERIRIWRIRSDPGDRAFSER